MGSIAPSLSKKSSAELRVERVRTPQPPTDLIVACLWPKNGENLGTTLRTCDALGATLVVPRDANAVRAIRRGNTIGLHNSNVDLIDEAPLWWLLARRESHRLVAVELAHGSTPLRDLAPATGPTVALLGHETTGVPQTALTLCHEAVEIPMEGVGNSLNVSVAAALVLYKLKGWA